MKHFFGVLKSVVLASGTDQVHLGLALNYGKQSAISGAAPDKLSKFLEHKVKITGNKEGLVISAKLIEDLETGEIWSI